jgi:hypothetical protein
MSCNKAMSMDASQKETAEPAHFLWADFHANGTPEQQTSQEAATLSIKVPSYGKAGWAETDLVNIFGPKSSHIQMISLIKGHSQLVASQKPKIQQAEPHSLGEKHDTNP